MHIQSSSAQARTPTPTSTTQGQQSKPDSTKSTPAQPQVKPLDLGMKRILNDQIDYLKQRNSGIQSMNYFYEVYRELYNNRVKELIQHKKQGKKIIGIFCNFIPLELVLAADAIPVRLASGFQDPILPAEEILPRNFCPLIKSSYGFSLMDSPYFDLADVIIIPTTCDGKKKLAEILSDKKETWVIEVPHTTETPQARQLWLTELELLKKMLEKLTGNKITSKKLKAAVKLVNRKRAAARKLYELRKRTPPPIWGRDAMLVTNLSLYDDVARWTERTEALCKELEKHKPVCDASFPRIMITGSPTVFPTWKIPVLTEESGGVIVMDDICTGSKELWDPIESAHWTMDDMLIASADKYLMNTCACFTPNLTRRNRIVNYVNEFKVDGVIYHVLQACHIYGMEQLRIEKAMDLLKIPVLGIETDYSQEDVEQIRTRIEAFLEMVTIRKSSKAALRKLAAPSIPTQPAQTAVSASSAPTTAPAADPTAAMAVPVADPTAAMAVPAADPTAAMAAPVGKPTPATPTIPAAQTTPKASPTQTTTSTPSATDTSAPPAEPTPQTSQPQVAKPVKEAAEEEEW